MLKLKLQYSGHLLWRTDSLEKALMLGKIEGRRRRGWQDEMIGWHHWQWTWVWPNSRRWWSTGKPGVLQSLGSQSGGHCLATDQQQTTLYYRVQCARQHRELWEGIHLFPISFKCSSLLLFQIQAPAGHFTFFELRVCLEPHCHILKLNVATLSMKSLSFSRALSSSQTDTELTSALSLRVCITSSASCTMLSKI